MSLRLKRPSAAMVVAGTALAVAVGGGTAFAASSALPANSVNTKQIVNQAVTYQKLADGQIGVAKLSPYVQQMLSEKGATGPQGPQGDTGPQGPKGDTGATGAAGKDGSATTPVTSLGGTWVDHSDGTDGTSTIDVSGAELGGNGTGGGLGDNNDYAGIATDALNGLTAADVSSISYTESYTMPTDSNLAAPYFKLKLQNGNDASTCGDTDVVYNPSVQSANLDYSGETETFNVTAPYSTVGVNNDANPVDGTYPVAIHSAKNGASGDVSGNKICLAEIILGGGSDATNAKATIYNVSFAGNGIKPVTYQFGTGQ